MLSIDEIESNTEKAIFLLSNMLPIVSHCFFAKDLFETFNKKQLKIKREVVQKKYGVNKRQALCASVFIYCMYLIILDIIKNNITFVLPLFNGKNAFIYMKPVRGEDFKKARQRGAFAGIDILASNFTGYQLTYEWEAPSGIRNKPAYISRQFKDMLYENINKGKQYF